ncbi:alpha-L-fucosidase [Amycolatopsis nigrescens]|uniref:alpha-L-fucosidase n=1 Tax=Amycolatopsis nigrescens TaxID=381445 RepID=UPI0007C461AF|nr:alpha-L-fucosidase [Amycolatopsis nigrescens]
MRSRVLTVAVAVALACPLIGVTTAAAGVATDGTEGRCTGPIRPAPLLTVEDCDSPGRILRKAAAVVPTPQQLAFQRLETTAFTHYGMNTFTDLEWGLGTEPETLFAPENVDVDQWMRAYKAAGAKQVMLTVKHHDGFVLYPSRYTNHSVLASDWWLDKNCPDLDPVRRARAGAEANRTAPDAYWQVRDAGCENPQGDVFGEYVRAARAAGLKVGVYLSPSDGAELPKSRVDDQGRHPAGQARYANKSAAVPRTIPTLVDGDDRAGRPLPTFEYTVNDYNAYYLNQIYEVLTQYGQVDEFWMDGANPWRDEGIVEDYDFTAYYDLIHRLAPQAVLFQAAAGVRWVGNEKGIARENEFSPVAMTADPRTDYAEWTYRGGAEAADLGSRAAITDPATRYLGWMPAEADVSIRPGWFFHRSQQPKSPAELVDLYRRSVGRNSVFLLNVPPGPDGRIAEADVRSLTSFGQSIKDTYRDANLLPRPWQPRGTTGELILDTGGRGFDQVVLGEDIARGQHIERVTVDGLVDGRWQRLAEAGTVGYQRILLLPEETTAQQLRVRVLQSRAEPRLSRVSVHRTAAPG